ncbi:MAG: FAD-dependent oxidoreductase, partial [Acidimicrobiia bacterium]
MVAAGRCPNVEGIGLEDLGVEVTAERVVVDGSGRTTVPSVYVAGDVAGRFGFTHSAAFDGVQAVRDMFLPGRGHAAGLVPWCTFTDPELAHVGMTAAEAADHHGADRVQVHRADLSHSDRARADGATTGAVVAVTAQDRIVGAHILAPTAGEMIHEFALAIHQGVRFDRLAGMVHVYPTLSTTTGRLAADAAFASARRWGWLARRPRLPLSLHSRLSAISRSLRARRRLRTGREGPHHSVQFLCLLCGRGACVKMVVERA